MSISKNCLKPEGDISLNPRSLSALIFINLNFGFEPNDSVRFKNVNSRFWTFLFLTSNVAKPGLLPNSGDIEGVAISPK